jgi:uncharacterized membrane protein YphA (DoxX/SURF4 family)
MCKNQAMKRLSGPFLILSMTTSAFLAVSRCAQAHEKWFHDPAPHPTQWTTAVQFPTIVGVGVALGLTAIAGLFWRARGCRDLIPGPTALGATPRGRAGFYALVPFILGIHVGVPLVVMGIKGELFSPNNDLSHGWLYWLGVAEIGIGLCFLYGGLTRLAGAALVALWLVGAVVVGWEPMLENLHYLGFAAFFYLTGRGPYAVDRLLFPALEPSPRLSLYAMPSLRALTGLGLAVVAFTEKLANPALAKAFLEHYPLNFTAWLGIPMSDDLFVLCAGTTELLIGLCLVFGFFPRVVIVTAWLFINMTLTIFNWVELLGHLPLYGVMGILLIWTPNRDDRQLWIEGVLGTPPARPADSDA